MRYAVICVGNEYQLDDGFGPAVARDLLARYELPSQVAVLDRAVMGYGILPDLREYDFIVTVDALDNTGTEPGTVLEFDPDDMATSAEMMSLHEVRFADVLDAARFMGAACEGHCFGVQVEDMGRGSLERGLSPAVAAAVPLTADAVASYLATERGLDVKPRDGKTGR